MNKFPKGNLGKKYTGPYRIHERAAYQIFKPEDCVFACGMADIGHPNVPYALFYQLMLRVKDQPCNVLLSTKNPAIYKTNHLIIPKNAILGFTMETDIALLGQKYSEAPDVWTRYLDMRWVQENLPNKRFVAVEPALKFTNPRKFADDIIRLEPWAVAYGLDNYNHHMTEPTLEESEAVMGYLEEAEVKVYRKTIREAWDGR